MRHSLIIVSAKGLGKCTLVEEFTPQNRGGKGVKMLQDYRKRQEMSLDVRLSMKMMR